VGLEDYVKPVVASSGEAARRWSGPIRLLFIDGDHAYEASRRDFELWSPFVTPLGVVCFHDIPGWPGVTKFYQELLAQPSGFREVATVVTMKVVQRGTG
jgi:Methyltransferase domain